MTFGEVANQWRANPFLKFRRWGHRDCVTNRDGKLVLVSGVSFEQWEPDLRDILADDWELGADYTFDVALAALAEGKRIRRIGWNLGMHKDGDLRLSAADVLAKDWIVLD